MPEADNRNPKTHANADPASLLEQHRRDIEALDRRVLHLVCERLELARQIGELKTACRVPLRNFRVETQVHARMGRACEVLGLDHSLGRDLARFLIEKAVEEQASLMDSTFAGDHLKALVVGGKGGMGRWIARFLAGQGHEVSVYDPSSDECSFPEVSDLGEAAATADLVVLAVPMTVCAEVLTELASGGTKAVVAEMCSLKSFMADELAAVREAGLRVVSFHPLFGPDVRMLSGRIIVFCNDGREQDVAFLRNLFVDTSAELVDMDMAEHDRRMALILGLTHFSNLVFARALAGSGVKASELAEVAGVTFQKQLATTTEFTAENPELYFQIQALNPLTPDTAAALESAVRELAVVVEGGDKTEFTRLMTSCNEYLANGRGEAQ